MSCLFLNLILYFYILKININFILSFTLKQKQNNMTTETQLKTLIDECKTWYSSLGSYKEKINQLKSELYFFAPGKTDHDTRLGIEHFHNQFHIHLINIHDMKHEIRQYMLQTERTGDTDVAPVEPVKEKLDLLTSDIDQLETEFHEFIKK